MAYWGSFGRGLAPSLEQITRYQLMKPMLEREAEMKRQEREDEYRRRQQETEEERRYSEGQKEKELRRTSSIAREGFKGGLEPSEYEDYLREQQLPSGGEGPVLESDFGGMSLDDALSESARLGGYAGRMSGEREYARDIGKTIAKAGIPNTDFERFLDTRMRESGKTMAEATSKDMVAAKKDFAESGHAVNLSGISGMYNEFAGDLDSMAISTAEGRIPIPNPAGRLSLTDRLLVGKVDKYLKEAGEEATPTDLYTDYKFLEKAGLSANSPVLQRQRSAIYTVEQQWPILEEAIADWNPTNAKFYNKAAIWARAQVAGDSEETRKAQALVTALSVFSPELAQYLKGTASPTDQDMEHSAKTLGGDFTGPQFYGALKTLKKDLFVRKRSMQQLHVVGRHGTENLFYKPPVAHYSKQNPPPSEAVFMDGDLYDLDDGRTAEYKGGKWIVP